MDGCELFVFDFFFTPTPHVSFGGYTAIFVVCLIGGCDGCFIIRGWSGCG
jgi:hypothetical protein